ncbi:bifunctional diaminohydroxyphosphoribosylaminopyrimidine deaminase/5-amino-6-(5-phosphoribosylamino)uracil reductase RibD [Corallincola holothuriorum]|uniref:Riboflavin biosynthesis protein RibD n=1 Tax=Corallincola holothuriorum TaxID=2282215 RepID=A0A368N4U4_9GAMM|nr:bifunctional diaminohydroxyphosphoribosylaminopyrimidine deaminase/5-amino-6-(5-phosphoribosylamino)uracil reductase RibD [Corallincola holothuriorum]RCU45236.1 bifunctional diaminohydroxyphosphoribosylaminopyrimidine deaminase/5-amino-6-(5-phosphoribosylamino)uracil reductase RibD [Corallincola holothuriorum]
MARFSPDDHRFMQRAIHLAERALYTTSPNPRVGCVIVNAGQIVGEGYHRRAGEGHAEVNALAEAGEQANGATCYVTLEPCSHHGRTGPCAEALVHAGVTEVVVAMVDPNPLVSGQGIGLLEASGIRVRYGLMEAQAEGLNPGFIKRMQSGMPLVRLKMAASLDGRTALSNGKSQWITGAAARADVQHWRARSCAIVTGSGTALADDPALNVRPEQLTQDYPLPVRQPVRVVVDGRKQISPALKMFQLPGELWIARKAADVEAPWQENVTMLAIPELEGKLDLRNLMRQLASKEINEVWVEAGGRLAGALLNAGLVDELILYLAPKLMGNSAQGLFNLTEFDDMAQLPELDWQDIRQVGDDLRIVATFKPKLDD